MRHDSKQDHQDSVFLGAFCSKNLIYENLLETAPLDVMLVCMLVY